MINCAQFVNGQIMICQTLTDSGTMKIHTLSRLPVETKFKQSGEDVTNQVITTIGSNMPYLKYNAAAEAPGDWATSRLNLVYS